MGCVSSSRRRGVSKTGHVTMAQACWDSARGSGVTEKGSRQKGAFMRPVRVKPKQKAASPSFGGVSKAQLVECRRSRPTVPDPLGQEGQPTTATVTQFCSLITLSRRNPNQRQPDGPPPPLHMSWRAMWRWTGRVAGAGRVSHNSSPSHCS